MWVSTARYAGKKTREFAEAFAGSSGSAYCARGKKSVENLVSLARRKGENTLALVSEGRISFISVSSSDWGWKDGILLVKGYKIHETGEGEIGNIGGKDAPLIEKLFGVDSFYSGEITVNAEKGKMKFMSGEEKTLLEIEYEISGGKDEE